jgi:hypothetical protein
VDGLTWGKGVYDMLRNSGISDLLSFVDARRRSSNNRRFKNLRAELHFKLAEAFIEGHIAIEDDDELVAQLSVLRTVKDQELLQIVSKRTMRSEGIDSPNDTDALTFTYFFNDNYYTSDPLVEENTRDPYAKDILANTTWMGL